MEQIALDKRIPLHLSKDSYKIISERRIFLKDLEIEVDLLKHYFFVSTFSFAYNLFINGKAKFSNEEEELFITISSLKINVQTGEELFVLNEIFVKKVYSFLPAGKTILIDIGMNVGITSLLFATLENVKKIYGFEPFYETFNQAKKNFSMNPDYSGKITSYNYGLGGAKSTLELDFVKEFKANMSTTHTPDNLPAWCVRTKEQVEIHDAKEEISKIAKESKDFYKILKVDCEGAEYEILERLDQSGLLNEMNSIIVEWHHKGPFDLIEILKRNNFNILSFDDESSNIGMLYSFK